MLRTTTLVVATVIGSASMAFAQNDTRGTSAPAAPAQETRQPAGAGTVEIMAAPVGGLFFTTSASTIEPHFANYALGASFTGNFNQWFGLEAEAGWAVSRSQALTFHQVFLPSQKTPNLLNYSASLVYSPVGSHHAVVPYVAAGVGGLMLMNNADLDSIGITSSQTFVTGNVGGGLKWFVNHHWGLRGDYRYFYIRHDTAAATSDFFGQENRHAHRFYGAIVVTF